jgi:hypothetical protein
MSLSRINFDNSVTENGVEQKGESVEGEETFPQEQGWMWNLHLYV